MVNTRCNILTLIKCPTLKKTQPIITLCKVSWMTQLPLFISFRWERIESLFLQKHAFIKIFQLTVSKVSKLCEVLKVWKLLAEGLGTAVLFISQRFLFLQSSSTKYFTLLNMLSYSVKAVLFAIKKRLEIIMMQQ